MLASLCAMGVAAVVYVAFGFAWQGFAGRPAHAFIIAGKAWNWIAAEPFFFRGLEIGGSPASLAAWLQLLSVGLAALIPLGAGADRWRLGASCASTALLAGWTYPLFAHWVWGGGWLAQLGMNYGLGRGFVDAGGASSIHSVGGLTALSIAWILGPRRGKYTSEGMPAAIPGHNAVLVLFACVLALLGWLGLNCAGAILFTGAETAGAVLVAINTTLSAFSALLAAALMTRARFGRPDASLCANGWVGGLVASSAVCVSVAPIAAILIGLVAGALVTLSVEAFELHFTVDDPGGAISVHAVCGIWGILALGLFGANDAGQWLAQVVGIATLFGFVLPLTYGLNWLLNRVYPQRVAVEGERQGMDLFELGAGAYPDFSTHAEEFPPR
jgi:Amt family ammonium transporter